MAIPDFYAFALGEFNATAARKIKIKVALAKQWGWEAKVEDKDGNKIDNPVSFQEEFNKNRVWRYLREEMEAGQGQLDKDAAEPTDDFRDLVE